ncbi:MAG TPA: sulfotransferase [Solirubrobacteraceae bacterium]|nr:sulfotransferase [Solirubrobacteraceae bacterium]
MKVIGAGLPRTGTLTQKMALEMLGLGPCYHMVNVLADLGQADLWARALDGEAVWDEVFDGFQSTVDWPGGYFTEALADRYPEAKVVLSVRDKQRWAESMHETVWAVRNGDSLTRLLSDARARIDPQWSAFLGMIDALLWRGAGTFADARESMDALIETAYAHEASVRAAIPAERLLVWDVREGWEPLCAFLELPVPEVELPHINDRAEFIGRIADGTIEALQRWRADATAAQDGVESAEPSAER